MHRTDGKPEYLVIHPLDDLPEVKRAAPGMGRMKLTVTAKVSLIALRAYLIVMLVLVTYRVFIMATSR